MGQFVKSSNQEVLEHPTLMPQGWDSLVLITAIFIRYGGMNPL
jgi:hypothetical protein